MAEVQIPGLLGPVQTMKWLSLELSLGHRLVPWGRFTGCFFFPVSYLLPLSLENLLTIDFSAASGDPTQDSGYF
jgi:hypothetical protein